MADEIHGGMGVDLTYTFNGLIDEKTPVEAIIEPAELGTAKVGAFDSATDTMMVSLEHNGNAGPGTLTIKADVDLGSGQFFLFSDAYEFEMIPTGGATGVTFVASPERPTP